MSFRIQHNVAALNSHRHLSSNNSMLNKALERLSSGYRINSGADDAAGLATSMRFRGEIASLKVASRNAVEATSLLQVAEGAMSQLELIMVRMKELATQAASGNAGSARSKIDAECQHLENEITRIINYTEYDGQVLLTGSFGATDLSSTGPTGLTATNGVEYIDVSTASGDTTFSVTAISVAGGTMTMQNDTTSATETIDISAAIGLGINENAVLNFANLGVSMTVNEQFDDALTNGDINTTDPSSVSTGPTGNAMFQIGDKNNANNRLGFGLPDLSLNTLANGNSLDVDLSSQTTAQNALTTIDDAISTLALARADVGALINRISYASSNIAVSIENKTASESAIRDVDMAAEMSEFTKFNILVQAGVSMQAQANAVPQNILSLLR